MRVADARGIGAVVARLEAGVAPDDAWARVLGVGVEADGAPAIAGHAAREVRAAARLSRETGAPLAAVLRVVAEALAARDDVRQRREAALAGVRASERLLLALPWAGVAMAALVEPRTFEVLTGTAFGWALVTVGSALAFAGSKWMRALIENAERAGEDSPPVSLALALAEAAVHSGAAVPRALASVGAALAAEGKQLREVARSLVAGDPWAEAWGRAEPNWAPLRAALEPAWWEGASPMPVLRAERESRARELSGQAAEAASRLEVLSALPLALCLLPAFVVVGIVPLVVAVAGAAVAAT